MTQDLVYYRQFHAGWGSLTAAVLAAGTKWPPPPGYPEQLKDLETQYPGQVLPLRLDVTDHRRCIGPWPTPWAHFREK